MGNYSSSAAVAKRLPTRTLDANSKPAAADVDTWILELEAELDGLLLSIGVGVPVTSTRGVLILSAKVASGATARWKNGIAIGTTFEDGRTADEDWKEWQAWLTKIAEEPATVGAMLAASSSGASAGTSQLRSYATDNGDGLSIANGDFDMPATLKEKY